MMKERQITVAAAQIAQTDTPSQNLERMVSVTESAGTDVVVFPETQLSGLNKDLDLTPLHKAISEQARNRKLWVVYGSYHHEDGQVFNTAQIVDNHGSLRLSYQKMHLWNEPGVTPGRNNWTISTEIGNLGIVICWDLAFPSSVQNLVKQGAEIVFCPSYWYGKQFKTTDVIEDMPLTRAFENQIYLVYCDAFTKNRETAGRSKICSPLEVLAAAKPQQEDVIKATLDLGRLSKLRQTFDCWKD